MKQVATFLDRFNELAGNDTYATLSEKLGVGKATICAWRNDGSNPRVPVLFKLAEYYNVDPWWLAGADVPKYKEIDGINPNDLSVTDIFGLSADAKEIVNAIRGMSEEDIKLLRSIVDRLPRHEQ